MIRRALGVTAALTVLGAGLGAPAAHGEPPPPCGFQLSTPMVEQRPGGAVVAATVTPGTCNPPGEADVSVACLQALNGNSTRLCVQGRGAGGARVELPLQPGTAYEATGRGLPRFIGFDPSPEWQVLGPVSATL